MKLKSQVRAGLCMASALALLSASIAAQAEGLDEIIAGAKQEGELTIIAVPHDWCKYADVIDSFKAKYPFLKANELDPDAGSGDEIEAIKANKGNKGPQNPDVIDVGLSFGPSSKKEGLLQPYKVSTWDSIPEGQKDPEGYWYGNYYGVLSFEINADLVPNPPTDWPDLLKPEYANMVALDDDPRSSNMSIQSVFASGLSASGDPEKAAEAGLRFFAELNKNGNLVPAGGNAATLAQGTTPIILRWDYLALGDRDTLNGNPPVTILVPKTGIVAGVYASAINAYAPHPNAAKLWMEHLYSDESQIKWLEGYCHPIRFADLVKNNKVPQALLDKLPPASAYEAAMFPSLEIQAKSKEIITKQWDSVVGANIQ